MRPFTYSNFLEIHTTGFVNSLFLVVAHLPEEGHLGCFLCGEIMNETKHPCVAFCLQLSFHLS